MSKCRSMYAGSSGAVYNVNANSPGNGNGKWQGLAPITNMRPHLVPYVRTRANGDDRNVVFCMNQLGGVGRISNMFASTADGVHSESCAHSAGSALGAVLAGSSNGNNSSSDINNSITLEWQGAKDFYDVSPTYGWTSPPWQFVGYTPLISGDQALSTKYGMNEKERQKENNGITVEYYYYNITLENFRYEISGTEGDASTLSTLNVVIQDEGDWTGPDAQAEYAITLNPGTSSNDKKDGTFTAQLTKGDDILRLNEAQTYSDFTYSLFSIN